MTIRRQARPETYTIVNNKVFQDGVLSYQAMGMLAYLLSKPDHWEVNIEHLIGVTKGTAKKTGRDGIYAILKELILAGYVDRKKTSEGKTEYIVHDEPITANPDKGEMPNTANPDKGKQPNPEKPDPGKPDPANTTLVNTDPLVNTDGKKPPKSPLEKSKLKDIPSGLNISAWQEWINYKRSIGAQYKTERGELVQANKLIGMSGGDMEYQAFMVSNAIDMEWKGIYLPRDRKPKQVAKLDRNTEVLNEWLNSDEKSPGQTYEHGE